jgi:hypothetical protein
MTQLIVTEDIGQDTWLHTSKELLNKSNLICLTKDEFKTPDYNPLIWFGSNMAQFLTTSGESEICPLFGKHIRSISDFCYQLCRTIPWGFEMGKSSHAICDVVLNFTTQPKNRYFIWHDAQYLLNRDRKLFEDIFECLIVASYLNSHGKATHDYQVNQKVLFLFDQTSEEDVLELCSKHYYTPSIFDNFKKVEEYYVWHNQSLVLVK